MSIATAPKGQPANSLRLWKTRDVAEFFGVTVGTVGEWVKQGKIPPGTKIGRGRRWNPLDIQRLAGL
jgi:predicted site-specific integrase-resolvase